MKIGKTKLLFDIETLGLNNENHMFLYSSETAKKITEKGQCLISDMLKYIEENNIGVNIGIKKSFTRHEKIGDTIYPVTYGTNGIITIDYADQPLLKTKSNDISTGSTN